MYALLSTHDNIFVTFVEEELARLSRETGRYVLVPRIKTICYTVTPARHFDALARISPTTNVA